MVRGRLQQALHHLRIRALAPTQACRRNLKWHRNGGLVRLVYPRTPHPRAPRASSRGTGVNNTEMLTTAQPQMVAAPIPSQLWTQLERAFGFCHAASALCGERLGSAGRVTVRSHGTFSEEPSTLHTRDFPFPRSRAILRWECYRERRSIYCFAFTCLRRTINEEISGVPHPLLSRPHPHLPHCRLTPLRDETAK